MRIGLDLAKVRLEEHMQLIENRMTDCCDERSKISHELCQLETAVHRKRYENRIAELDLEINLLWKRYRYLAGMSV